MNAKELMIEKQLKGRDIHDENVLNAMREIDRELFIPPYMHSRAYDDNALPIGHNQTISQPYIVAYMAQSLGLHPDDRLLEVGTGCGYNAAVLSRLVNHVYSIEIIEWLAQLSGENLKRAGISNVSTCNGDGYRGWAEHAPFDKIMVTAAAPHIPEPLKKQLNTGGKILVPVGTSFQNLVLLIKINEDVFEEQRLIPVRFVPMTGKARK